MAKIDLITLTGLTATDGSVIASGATIKFSSEFQIRSTDVMVRPKIFRNRELFEMGFHSVGTNEIPNELILKLTEEDFYVLTPAKLYEKVRDYLNTWYGADIFEINIIN